jgi:hypothetical protein
MMHKYFLTGLTLCFLSIIAGCDDQESRAPLKLLTARIGTTELNRNSGSITTDVPANFPIVLNFSAAVDEQSAQSAVELVDESGSTVPIVISQQDNGKTVVADPEQNLEAKSNYTLTLNDGLKGSNNEIFTPLSIVFKTAVGQLNVQQWSIGGNSLPGSPIQNVPLTMDLQITFGTPLDLASVSTSSVTLSGPTSPALIYEFSDDHRTITIHTNEPLRDLSKYRFVINDHLTGADDETFGSFDITFYTMPSSTPKFPVISDEELLTLVQQQTFKYFWDFAHPTSGMARERNTSGDIVTTGGTGFGVMAIIVAIERNFITRADGIARLDKIVTFLTSADRFHGAWPHWMNGVTGKVVPFSANDNGGDLVETSFLIQGLLTVRQYLNPADVVENALISKINTLWQTVEWDWYTRGGQNVLYWHWSPIGEWVMNHQIRGHNETLITYVLAASSPTHTIAKNVYIEGYARSGAIKNGKSFYGIELPLGEDYGGPLFFAHYSFLGLDPRNLSDSYANYWQQNVNHSTINQKYVIANPKNFVAYSEENWGLTASDNHLGYSAHSPLNDLGVITPTAAISSIPYTPEASLKALKFFYYKLGDRLWGNYGFKDAFNVTEGWYASSCLAIDQGPIVIMIENYRTGVLWNLFMSAPEVQTGLTKLGFTY